MISFAVAAKLICAFVFAYAKSLFSRDAAHMCTLLYLLEKSAVQKLSVFGYVVGPKIYVHCMS